MNLKFSSNVNYTKLSETRKKLIAPNGLFIMHLFVRMYVLKLVQLASRVRNKMAKHPVIILYTAQK